ncbi:RND family transporter, partial [bacterium]
GVMGLAGIPLDVMTITIVAIVVGIAVDNTMHYLHRFEEEFHKDRDYRATMYRCHGSVGHAMLYATLTNATGFCILALSNFKPTILFGTLTAFALAVALLMAMTLLPLLVIHFKPYGPEGKLG